MTNDDMVETLAKRLKRMFHSCGVCAEDDSVSDYWLAMARECLRQMEWARRRLKVFYDSNGSDFYVEVDRRETSMTLAPDDWQP